MLRYLRSNRLLKRPTTVSIAVIFFTGIFLFGADLSAGNSELKNDADILGIWETEKDRSRIKFYKCDEAICGKLVWLADRGALDTNNPDPKLRSRPLKGLTLFRNFKPAGKHKWTGGTVYDPEDGTINGDEAVDISLTLKSSDRLEVEGCFTIVCQDNVMTRYR